MTESQATAASSTANETTATAAPAAAPAQPPAAPPVAPPAGAAPPPAPAPQQTPAAPASPAAPAAPPTDDKFPWLAERLSQARRTGVNEKLQTFGLKDESELKARLEELDALKKAAMTAEERREAELAELKPKAEKVSQYETIIRARVTAELADLTEEQSAAVRALAGDDPARTLQAIDTLKPTWAKQAAAVSASTETPAPATPPTPATTPAANTAPARGSAPSEIHESPPDHKAVWESLEKTNPFKAAAYLRQHKAEIFPSGS